MTVIAFPNRQHQPDQPAKPADMCCAVGGFNTVIAEVGQLRDGLDGQLLTDAPTIVDRLNRWHRHLTTALEMATTPPVSRTTPKPRSEPS